MNEPFNPIEVELQHSANRFRTEAASDTVCQLLRERARRDLRRRKIQTWCGVAVLVVAMAGVGVGGQRFANRLNTPIATHSEKAIIVPRAISTPSKSNVVVREPRIDRVSESPVSFPGGVIQHQVGHPMNSQVTPEAYFPLMMTVPTGDSETRVIPTGLYVPVRRVEIRWVDLSPAQQEAVRRLLGQRQDVENGNIF